MEYFTGNLNIGNDKDNIARIDRMFSKFNAVANSSDTLWVLGNMFDADHWAGRKETVRPVCPINLVIGENELRIIKERFQSSTEDFYKYLISKYDVNSLIDSGVKLKLFGVAFTLDTKTRGSQVVCPSIYSNSDTYKKITNAGINVAAKVYGHTVVSLSDMYELYWEAKRDPSTGLVKSWQ